MKLGFVDVGGGTRGIYGAGVFDYLMEEGISGDYFIGVSAGAANGASFLPSNQEEILSFIIIMPLEKNIWVLKNYLKTGSYIDLDYIYSDLSASNGENPLDYKTMMENPMEFEIVATDARTGRPKYFNKKDLIIDEYDPIKASCCVPVLCNPYEVNGVPYFDGGLSDPIPLRKPLKQAVTRLFLF